MYVKNIAVCANNITECLSGNENSSNFAASKDKRITKHTLINIKDLKKG